MRKTETNVLFFRLTTIKNTVSSYINLNVGYRSYLHTCVCLVFGVLSQSTKRLSQHFFKTKIKTWNVKKYKKLLLSDYVTCKYLQSICRVSAAQRSKIKKSVSELQDF